MVTTARSPLAQTAEDVMCREVVSVPRQMPLQDASLLLSRAGLRWAVVVDELGRCVGVLSAADCLRRANEGEAAPCPYQVRGRLLTGEGAVICTLSEGSCPLQQMRPTTQGRHTAVCLRPPGAPRAGEPNPCFAP